LYKINHKQSIYQIGSIKIGGQPGELPTVLIGNLFYKGMPEVTNHKEGSFDKRKVMKWIKVAEELSEKSGTPHLLDLMAMYPKAIRSYITFLTENSRDSFVVDGANPETRMAALVLVEELGIQKKVIYNGVDVKTSQEELEAIQDAGINAAVIMTHNESDYSPKGRLMMLKGSADHMGLLAIAEKVGIRKILVDTVVYDIPSISYAIKAIALVKQELGYPAGCSPANATYEWKSMIGNSILREGFAASNASAHTIAQCSGADFLIYGPIKQAKNMIPAVAINDAIIAYFAQRQLGIKPLAKDHPLYKIF
jgi:tetrahydromethanopterin S-methyltransferase subunit H